MTKDKIFKDIIQNIRDWLYTLGFKKNNQDVDIYLSEKDKCSDLLTFNFELTETNNTYISIQLFSRKIKLIESYWEEFINNPVEISSFFNDTIRGSDSRIFHDFNLHEAEPHMVETICDKVKSDYFTYVLPKLDEYSNIHKLDALANGEDKTFSLGNSERYFRKLIIARLAENPKYEEIYKEMTDLYKKIILDEPTDEYYQNMLWVIEQLYEKLKDVQPLENPILV